MFHLSQMVAGEVRFHSVLCLFCRRCLSHLPFPRLYPVPNAMLCCAIDAVTDTLKPSPNTTLC